MVKWFAQSEVVSDWGGIKLRTVWFKSLCCFCHTKLLLHGTFYNSLSGIVILRAIHSLEGLNERTSSHFWIYIFLPLNGYIGILIVLVYICVNNFLTLCRFSLWLILLFPAWDLTCTVVYCSLNVCVRNCVKEGAARQASEPFSR